MTLTELRHDYLAEVDPTAEWKELEVAGVRCEAFVAGEGAPLVLMHGGIDSCMQWVPILPELTEHFRVFAPERPSNGASDTFDYGSLHTDFRRHAEGVVRDMLDGLGIERAGFVANSMGACFTLAFATAHPDRVERVVCVGVPAGHDEPPLPLPIRLMGHPLTRDLIAWLSKRAGERDARRILDQLVMKDPDRCPDRLLEIAVETTRRNAEAWRDFVARVASGREVAPDLRSRDWLDELQVPLDYIVGTDDAFGSVTHLRSIAEEVDADVTVIQDAGHLPWLDQPDATTAAILKSLAVERSDR